MRLKASINCHLFFSDVFVYQVIIRIFEDFMNIYLKRSWVFTDPQTGSLWVDWLWVIYTHHYDATKPASIIQQMESFNCSHQSSSQGLAAAPDRKVNA